MPMTQPAHDLTNAERRIAERKLWRSGFIGSAIVHVTAILLVWLASPVPRQIPDLPAFEIELISPVAAELGEPTPPPPEELVITTPFDPVRESQEEIPAVTVEEEEEEEPVEETPEPETTVTPLDVELVDEPEPATSLNPNPEVETPGEDLNVRMEGLQREYPEYYDNIRLQMRRCFQWRGDSDLLVRIYFVINRDGSVSQVDVLEPSRSIAFDIQVMGAAECAGRPGGLGPLPEELHYDRFGVVFWIEHRTR